MGNIDSQSLCTDEALAIYSKLINMSFEEDICLEAAKKYPKNLNKAMDYVIKQTKSKSEMHEEMDLKESDITCSKQPNECPHVQNVVSILQKFDDINDIQKQSILDSLFPSSSRVHIIKLMICFSHIQLYHNRNKMDRNYYQNIIGDHCQKKQKHNDKVSCLRESRHVKRRRDFTQYDMIQNSIDNVREINLIRLLDTIHCCLLHETLSCSTKFITNIHDEKEEKSNKLNAINILKSKLVGFGKQNEYENLPKYEFGTAFNIKPKYENFKDEFMNNKLYQLNRMQYECLLQSAYDKMECYKSIFVVREYENTSNLHCGDKISTEHIMCIMSYCNETEMQRRYKNGFKHLNIDKNEKDIKQRQSEIAIWTKLLFEAVSLFGDIFKFGEKVYHGLSCKLEFGFMGNTFSIPTSTSMSYNVAERFATNNGIILQLTRTTAIDQHNLYFDVYSKYIFSDFPWEQERLIFGAAMGFSNIMYEDKFDKLFHGEEIMSLYLYQQIINGKHFSHRQDIFKKKYQQNIVKYTVALWDNDDNLNYVDGYILYLFKAITENIEYFRFLKDEFYKLSNELQEILSIYENILVPPVISINIATNQLLHPKLFSNGQIKSDVFQYEYMTSVLVGKAWEKRLKKRNKISAIFQNLKEDNNSKMNIYEEQSRKVGVYFIMFKSYDQLEEKTYLDLCVGIEQLPKLVNFINITVSIWMEQILFEAFLCERLSEEKLYSGCHLFETNKIKDIQHLKVEMAIQDVKVDDNEDTTYFQPIMGAGPRRLFHLF